MLKALVFGCVLLSSSFFLVNCQYVVNQEVSDDVAKQSLRLVLDFLNDDIKAAFNYNSGRILHSQLKGNILEIDLQVSLTCKVNDDQCDYDTALCKGVLYEPVERELQVLSVDCNPKSTIIEEPLALPVQTQTCTGCLTDVNVDVKGVEPMVNSIIQHIQSEQKRHFWPLKILRLQRQVTNGVNFVLTVQLGADRCNFDGLECIEKSEAATLTCLVKFHQEAGYEKPKNIISNNCTDSQTFVPTGSDAHDLNKISPDNPKSSAHEKTPERTENDILSELMSQIIPLDKFEPTPKKDVELVQPNPVKNIESSSIHNLVDENGQPLIISSTFQEVLATEDEPISVGTDTSDNHDATPKNPSTLDGANETPSSTSATATSESKNTIEVIAVGVEREDQNASKDGHPSNEESRTKRSTVNSEKFSPGEKAAIQKITDFVASTLDLIDDDDHKRVVLKVINVKKVKSDNLFLNMNLRIGVSKCAETDNDVDCKKDLLNDLTKYCKVQVMIDENYGNPKVVKSHCENERRESQKSNRTSNDRRKRALLGGKEELRVDDPKVKKYLGEAVNYMNTKLSNGDTQFGINKVLSATSQIVEGVSYDIKVEMSTSCSNKENSIEKCESLPKICDINVWYRPWLNSRLITIDCGGPHVSFNALDPKNYEKRSISRVSRDLSNRRTRNIIRALNKLLPELESQSEVSYKLKIKEILSAKSQVVVGVNWKIKAKVISTNCLISDNTPREECDENEHPFESICKFKFLQPLPNDEGISNFERIHISCDGSQLKYSNKRDERILVGGHNPVSNDDPRIFEHLNGLLPKLESQYGEKRMWRIKKVISATNQVVAGTKWNVKAVVRSDCLKESEKYSKACVGNDNTLETVCIFKFWEKLPTKDGVRQLDNVEISCEDNKLRYRSEHEEKRTKRQIVGGHNPVSTDDPRISGHLDGLLKKLDSQSGEKHTFKIKEVLSATSQVVAGTNWNIKAVVVLTDCLKTEDKDSKNCGENKKNLEAICTFKFWEKLPNKDGVRKLDNIEISCENPKLKYKNQQDADENKRTKRKIKGGHNPISTDDPRISEHLNGLLEKLDSQSSEKHTFKIKKVLSATTQVVAGTNWKIKAVIVASTCLKSDVKDTKDCVDNKDNFIETICTFEFWEKLPNEDGVSELDNIKVSCENSNIKLNSKQDLEQKRTKRQIVGGHNPVSIDDPRIPGHLDGLLKKLDSQSGEKHKLKIKKVISATTQVVAGTNWKIKAVVVLSDCSKEEDKDVKNCGENKDKTIETICTFKFWEKLPNKDGVRELDNIEVSCENPKLTLSSKQGDHEQKRTKRQIVGGHNPVSTDDPRISGHLDGLLKKLDSQSGEKHKLKIKKVISATSQVVAGTNWNIKAVVVLSDCSKEEDKDVKNCDENKDKTIETICTFKFWEKLPNKDGVRELDNIEVSCENPKLTLSSKQGEHEQKRTKRQIVGGHNPVSTDDPRITKHLHGLLKKLDSQSGEEHKFKVKKVISATSQVVAGTNWNIKAVVVLSDCLKTVEKDPKDCKENEKKLEAVCTFKFWERLPNKDGVRTLDDIEVSCENPKLKKYTSKRDVHEQSRKKRQLVGGHTPVQTDDPRISGHLNGLLEKLDSQSGETHKLKIKKVISATSQVVAGTNWNIEAIVVLSDCSKTDLKHPKDCGDNKKNLESNCIFKFWEKLPNKDGIRPLDNIEVSCKNQDWKYNSEDISQKRTKRQILGGHNPVAIDNPELLKHLNSFMPQLDLKSEKEHKLKVKEILSATSQVVAGTNWYIKAKVILSDCLKSDEKNREACGENQEKFESVCVFKFLEKLPDKNRDRLKENIDITCDDAPKLNIRSKRDVGLIGEEQEVDRSEPKIYEYLSKSLQHIDLNSPEEYKYKVKEIISATKQVVSGVLWKLKVNIVLSDCSKNDVTDWDQCGDLQGAESKLCTVKIWDRPWLKQGRETNITCDNQKHVYTFRSKRSPKIEKGLLGQEDRDLDYSLFKDFEQKYDKKYSSPKERAYRLNVFRENRKYVKLLNEHEMGTATYGVTQFADMTRKEFSLGLGYRNDLRQDNENEISFMQAEIPDIELPDSFDWREKHAVAEVKNQGSCGSCWAFSVTGNVEGQYAIKYGKLLEFSEQELVDCDSVDQGCNGGLMDNAYRQIEKLGGLESETDYPYDARDEKCHFNKSLSRVQLSGAVNISTDENDMAKWLTKNGPISIAINANAMQFYMGGVSHPWKFLCNPKSLDHGVLIVGYGVHTYPKFKKSLPYWIVKNSWGTSWGEQGYYRVYRGDGTCGVNQTPSSAIVK